MKAFSVPGLALAIVKDGKIIVAKGYGVRKLGDATAVDEHTMFGIGSNTKAFTTVALAMLMDAGKLSWDDPVYQRLPGFVMYDPYVSHEMTIRDLLTHRSGMGLGEGDLLFWPKTTYTRDEIVYKLRFMKPASSFRSKYAYDNLLYMTAGQIIPAVTGISWDEYIRHNIFVPLGMNNSNTTTKAFKAGDDYAFPHSGAVTVRPKIAVQLGLDLVPQLLRHDAWMFSGIPAFAMSNFADVKTIAQKVVESATCQGGASKPSSLFRSPDLAFDLLAAQPRREFRDTAQFQIRGRTSYKRARLPSG
jgi:CubicO group peptidase (beta-lactamase class C family)